MDCRRCLSERQVAPSEPVAGVRGESCCLEEVDEYIACSSSNAPGSRGGRVVGVACRSKSPASLAQHLGRGWECPARHTNAAKPQSKQPRYGAAAVLALLSRTCGQCASSATSGLTERCQQDCDVR